MARWRKLQAFVELDGGCTPDVCYECYKLEFRSMNKTEMQAKQQLYVERIERLNGGAIDRLEWSKLYILLDEMTEGVPHVVQPIDTNSKVGRGRILSDSKQFDSINVLSYPPAEQCKSYGRCNKPSAPVLYAGVGTELILSEIGAKVGDIVGLLHFSPRSDVNCVRLGALNLWRRTAGDCLLPTNIKAQLEKIYQDPKNITAFLLDAFVSDYFSRESSLQVYKLTSAYTSVLFDSHPNIEGLIYESVNHTAGSCIAISTSSYDKKFTPTDAQIVRISSYLGYGVYDFEVIKQTDKFNGNLIVWD